MDMLYYCCTINNTFSKYVYLQIQDFKKYNTFTSVIQFGF